MSIYDLRFTIYDLRSSRACGAGMRSRSGRDVMELCVGVVTKGQCRVNFGQAMDAALHNPVPFEPTPARDLPLPLRLRFAVSRAAGARTPQIVNRKS